MGTSSSRITVHIKDLFDNLTMRAQEHDDFSSFTIKWDKGGANEISFLVADMDVYDLLAKLRSTIVQLEQEVCRLAQEEPQDITETSTADKMLNVYKSFFKV